MGSKADLRCTRALADQASDTTGAARREDHPNRSVGRLDLLSDEDLDAFRVRFPRTSEEALDAVEALVEAMRVLQEKLRDEVLEDRTEGRPILTVVACSTCGAYGISQVARPWPIDRAMRRSGLPEREVRSILVVLAEAFGDHDPASLDGLEAEALRELLALVGQDFDVETVRARYGGREDRNTAGS